MPAYLGSEEFFEKDGQNEQRKKNFSLTEKILKSAVDIENLTAPGSHALTQILLRLKFLKFGGYLEGLVR